MAELGENGEVPLPSLRGRRGLICGNLHQCEQGITPRMGERVAVDDFSGSLNSD
jgi:hypothetical protein